MTDDYARTTIHFAGGGTLDVDGDVGVVSDQMGAATRDAAGLCRVMAGDQSFLVNPLQVIYLGAARSRHTTVGYQ